MRVLLTRAMTRASTKMTRKPQPLLLAKLKAGPKIATPQATKRPVKVDIADAEAEATAPTPRPFAPAKIASHRACRRGPRPAPRAMANSEPAAPVETDEPVVKIFKVRPVPILDKARAAPPSPDETTDMEDIDTALPARPPKLETFNERPRSNGCERRCWRYGIRWKAVAALCRVRAGTPMTLLKPRSRATKHGRRRSTKNSRCLAAEPWVPNTALSWPLTSR